MVKVELPARLRMDFHVPIVVVSCSVGRNGKPKLITVGAVSDACHDPPMWGIVIGHTRYSY